MSAIQRWDLFAEVGINEPVKYGMWEAVEGRYVLYADHVAAVAAAEQRGREEAYNEIPAIAVYGERLRSEGYDVGYTDALAAAREVVAALMPGHYSLLDPSTGYNVSIVTDAVRKDEALAAIDGVVKP